MQQALRSEKTPGHLKPHIRKAIESMKSVKGQPITGAASEMKPARRSIFNGPETRQAENQIAAPPQPFQQPNSAANAPAPAGPIPNAGNFGMKGGSSPMTSTNPTGNGIPGHNDKVVGGRLGTSHPKRIGNPHNQPQARKRSSFYGER